MIANTSLCGLGQTSPNPVLTTLRYFREEYEEHIQEKKCRALACHALVKYEIDPDKCRGCGKCFANCPVQAVYKTNIPVHTVSWIHAIDQSKCTKCGTCYQVCPTMSDAIVKSSGVTPGDSNKEAGSLVEVGG